jgi:hypothetical protein
LLAAGAALLLSAGAAVAMPATAQTDLTVRSGPGTRYPVVGSIAGGETVDVASCTASWCRVSFAGGSGYASRRYLALAGAVVPGPAVAAAPYGYDDEYDYSDYGPAYGPSYGVYAAPGRWRGHTWHGHAGWQGGNHNAGNWQGRTGNWQGRGGNWQGRGNAAVASPGAQPGFAGPPAAWQRPGSGIGAGAAMNNAPVRSAPPAGAGARSGFAEPSRASASAPAPSAPAPSAPAGGASPGFAGSMVPR